MKIDIDICISSDNGEEKLFEKHFTGKLNQNRALIEDLECPNRRFCDFMYEFLTARGRRLREELYGHSEKKVVPKLSVKELIRDLEYTITLGTGQLLTGKVPLSSLNEQKEQLSVEKPYFRPAVEYDRIHSMERVEEFIQMFMIQAIDRYESSFHHGMKEKPNFFEKT